MLFKPKNIFYVALNVIILIVDMLSFVMLSFIVLRLVPLSFVMLSFAAPLKR
jgi:hypothetical protein